jgi:hypothetical protein
MRFAFLVVVASVGLAACSAPPAAVTPSAGAQARNRTSTAFDALSFNRDAGTQTDLPQPRSRLVAGAISKKSHLLYVSNYRSSSVEIYDLKGRHPQLAGTLTQGIYHPGSLCLAKDGTLYVPNESGATIAVYRFGAPYASRILTADRGGPTGCAVDASGNLWVADFNDSKVYEFLGGRNKVGTTIDVSCPDSIAFDASGNMYVGLLGFAVLGLCSPAQIDVFSPGASTPYESITADLYAVALLTDIALGPDGTLYAAAEGSTDDIVVFPSGASNPSETITNGTDGVYAMATTTSGRLYAGDDVFSQKPYRYSIVEFPPGTTSPGAQRISKGLHEVTGLAAWR